jgi:hypothetical protein
VDVEHLVAQRLDERGERLRRQQHAAALRRGVQRTQRGHGREQVSEPECAEHDEVRPYGHDGSTDGVMTSSRSSTPGGRVRAKITPAAISAGSTSWASGPGR